METLIIEKENLDNVTFTTSEVLDEPIDIKDRAAKLEKASVLGNGFKTKVKIYFKNVQNESCLINTTVWAAGPDFITVKGNRSIPIRAIYNVEL